MADKAELLREIKKLQGEINSLEKNSASITDEQIKKQRELKKEIVDRINQVKELNKERLALLASEESSMGSLTSMYDKLTSTQKTALDITYNGQQKNLEPATKILEINRSISQLTPDDEYQRLKLMTERGELMDSLDGRSRKLVSSLKEQNSLADTYANMTEQQKKILQSQHDVLDGIKNTIVGTIETAVTLYGNLQGAIGGVISGLGFVADKIGAANRELGTTLFQTDGVARKAGVLSFIFDDAVSNAKDLSAELGDTSRATFETQQNIGLMSMNMGISGSEAVALTGAFTRLNGNSTDIATDMVATSREFAKQNGIIPSQLMSDLAASAEEFALFGKQGGKNIVEAAGYAARLGTNMKTLSGISEGLLDFESSITKELELGAMLGKNINLNRARALAYEGKLGEATKETLNQLGGIEAFNRMDYFQKKQTADLLGTSVSELETMATNMENAGSMGNVINEKFSVLGEYLNGGINKYLGTSLKGIGGMITASAQVGSNFANMGFSLKGIGKKLGGLGGKITSKLGGLVGGKGGGSITDNIKPDKVPGKGIMDGMSKINMNAVLKGAAAMVIVAGTVFVFGKAVQEFMKVSWEAVGMAVVSMLALVGAVALLGAIMTSPMGAVAILAGAAAMLVIAASVLVLGHALQAIGTGFEMMSTGIASLTPNLLAVGTSILSMVTLLPMIGLLSIGLIALAGSLAYLALFGTLALPALMGLGFAMIVIGAGMGMIGSALTEIGTGFGMLSSVTGMIDGMVSNVGGIILLTGSLFALAAALTAVGTAGLISIPGLVALGAIGTAVNGINSLLGIESESTTAVNQESVQEYQTQMLNKLEEIRVATLSNKDVYLDRTKVTNLVMETSDRNSVNKFNINNA